MTPSMSQAMKATTCKKKHLEIQKEKPNGYRTPQKQIAEKKSSYQKNTKKKSSC